MSHEGWGNTNWGDFFSGLTVGFVIGATVIGYLAASSWENSTVEHGCAYYDPKTANFTWRNDEPDHLGIPTTKH